MSNAIHSEIEALAAEFSALRQSGNKRLFPENLWKRAIALTQQISIGQVCQAINVSSVYLKKKIVRFGSSAPEMTFVEFIPPKQDPSHTIKITIESSFGHKMMIDNINTVAIAPLLAEFLKGGGVSCCK